MEMKKKLIVPEIETHDLHLAAFLQAREAKLVRTKKKGNRVTFVFEGSEAATQLMGEWRAMTGQVMVHSFCAALRNLKDIVHAE